MNKTAERAAYRLKGEVSDRARFAQEALYWRSQYEDCEPDVGMGPTLDMMLTDIEHDAGIELFPEERKWVLLTASKRV